MKMNTKLSDNVKGLIGLIGFQLEFDGLSPFRLVRPAKYVAFFVLPAPCQDGCSGLLPPLKAFTSGSLLNLHQKLKRRLNCLWDSFQTGGVWDSLMLTFTYHTNVWPQINTGSATKSERCDWSENIKFSQFLLDPLSTTGAPTTGNTALAWT